MSRPTGDRRAQAQAAAHAAGDLVYRSRFGLLGTEPPAGRNPVRRYGSLVIGLGALCVAVAGPAQVAAILAAISLVLGAPRSWTWRNDLLSSVAWTVSVVLLVAAEIIYVTGGASVRVGFAGHRTPGTAVLLISLVPVVALLSYVRRWGTGGNSGLIGRGLRRGDPRTMAAVRRRAEREGYTPKHRDDDD